MAKPQTDEELNLKRKARRRLVGAVALTLAVVVILPMALDNEPKPTGKDLDLRIPAPDKVGEFIPGTPVSEVVEILPLAVSGVQASSALEAAPTLASSAPIEISAVVASNSPLTAPPNSVKKAEIAEQIKPVIAKPVELPSVTNKKTESQPSAVKKPTIDPQAILEGKDSKGESNASYAAQIGAFANAETAKQELSKLKNWGFKAYTEKVGDKVRVRVGPYAERDKVEKVRKLLENHGIHATLVSLK